MSTEKKTWKAILQSQLTVGVTLVAGIITAGYQYSLSQEQALASNYRTMVAQLALDDSDSRHAATASIGTFLTREDQGLLGTTTKSPHYEETIDILTNRLSSEDNFNVRNSIIGSLKKIKNEAGYRQVIERLLTINRNNFIQEYQMKTSLDAARKTYDSALAEYNQTEKDLRTVIWPQIYFRLR